MVKRLLCVFTALLIAISAIPTETSRAIAEQENDQTSVTMTDNGDGTMTRTETRMLTIEEMKTPEEIGELSMNQIMAETNLKGVEEGTSEDPDGSPADAEPEEENTENSPWRYRILENGWAIVTEYTDPGAVTVRVPSLLDGHPVAGLDAGVFSGCGTINTVILPLGAVQMDDRVFEGVEKQVTVHAPFGSLALAWAKDHGMAARAETSLYFTDAVVDFSDARAGALKVSGTQATVEGPEAMNIAEGSILFTKHAAWKVDSLSREGDRITARVSEPEAQETMTRIKVDITHMKYDASQSSYPEYASAHEVQEKISGSFSSSLVDLGFSVHLPPNGAPVTAIPGIPSSKWESKLKASVSLSGSLKVSVNGEMDVNLLTQTLYKAEYAVKISYTFSVDIAGTWEFDLFLGRVTFKDIFVAKAAIDTYFHIELEGKISISYSNSYKAGLKYNRSKDRWEEIKEEGSETKIEASATLKIGIKVKPFLEVLGMEFFNLSVFGGIKIEAKRPILKLSDKTDQITGEENTGFTYKNPCIDVNVELVLEASCKIDILSLFNFTFKIVNVSLHLGANPTFHLEFHQGRWKSMKTCTYESGEYAKITLIQNNGTENRILTMKKHQPMDTESLATVVKDSAADKYSFDSWYLDADYTTHVDYNEWVIEDMTLYGRWFYNAKALNVHDSVLGNKTIRIPANQPILDYLNQDFNVMQYHFQGLFFDEQYTVPVEKDSLMPEQDTDIYVKWEYDPSYNPFEGAKSIALLKFGPNPDLSGTYQVLSCAKGAQAITIPDEYLGKKVTAIAPKAFEECNQLVLVNLNKYITDIGNYAFRNCTRLNYVGVSSKIKNIGNEAFSNCGALTDFAFPITLEKLGMKAFYGTGLTSAIIPSSVTNIGTYVFQNCTALVQASMPPSWTEIPTGIFHGCTALEHVTLPSGTKTIGYEAFYDCAALEISTVPSSVTDIRGYAFGNCASIENMTLPETITSLGGYAFSGCTALESINLPNGLTDISSHCFNECKVLKINGLPSGLKSIGGYAFRQCYAITSLPIPESVTSIGEGAFVTTGLTSIEFPTNITKVPAYVVQGCVDLERVVLHEGITEIEKYAFMYCKKLSRVDLPSTMRIIREGAFRECDLLSTLNLNEGLNVLESSFIHSTPALTTLAIPSSVFWLGKYVFDGCYVKTLTIPEGITSLPDWAFNGAHCEEIILPSTLTSFGTQCFMHCEQLKSLFIPYGVTSIGQWEFGFCYNLKNVWIPPTVTFIGGYSFRTSYFVSYADGVQIYGEPGTAAQVFCEDANKPDKFHWGFHEYIYERPDGEGGNKAVSLDGFEYVASEEEATIVGYTGDATGTLTIPSTLGGVPVTGIADYAMSGDFSSVSIPETVTKIAATAFENAPRLLYFYVDRANPVYVAYSNVLYRNGENGLEMVRFGPARKMANYTVFSNTVAILDYAFSGVKGVVNVKLVNTVRTIGAMAFFGCEGLESITMSTGLTEIDEYAFAGCNAVKMYCAQAEGYVADYAARFSIPYNLYQVTYLLDGQTLFTCQAQAGHPLTDIEYYPEVDYQVFAGWYTATNRRTLWNFESDNMPFQNLTLYGYMSSEFAFRTADGEVTITGYNGTQTKLMIPESIGGLPVTGIAENAIVSGEERTYTLVTIPACVTTIADGAISGVGGIQGDRGFASEAYAEKTGIPFTARKYMLSFDCGFGSPIPTAEYEAGETIVIPETQWDNHQICGWFLSETWEEEWKETVMPTRDVRLYALWAQIDGVSTANILRLEYTEDGAMVAGYNGILPPELIIPEEMNGYAVIGISEYAFAGNETLHQVILPDTVRSIGEYAFSGSTLAEIKLGSGLNSVGEGAFERCTYLGELHLPEGVTTIPDRMAANCRSLQTVTWGARVTSIGEGALSGAIRLHAVSFGAALTRIGDRAFRDCETLETVSLPAGLSELGAEVFRGCTGLKSIAVKKGNPGYKSVDNRMLMSQTGLLLQYALGNGQTECILPEGTKQIAAGAFAQAESLQRVVISAGVNRIEEGAFREMMALEEVVFETDELVVIPEDAFYGCGKLGRVTLPDQLLKISDRAFASSGLAAVVIPSTVSEISETAFLNCGDLVIIGEAESYAETFAEKMKLTFITAGDIIPVTQLELPVAIVLKAGSYQQLDLTVLPADARETTIVWTTEDASVADVSQTGVVNGISSGMTKVKAETADGKVSAECEVRVFGTDETVEAVFVTFPTGLKTIEESAYEGTAFTAVDLRGTGCERILGRAFAAISSLQYAAIPKSVKFIAPDAFAESEDVILIVESNSYAEQYAKDNGYDMIVE